jgi:hypothetical protein
MSGAGAPLLLQAPRGWYLALLGGLLPVLVGGFLASAVADRPVFAGWALAAAAAYSAALRGAWGSAWPPGVRVAVPLAVIGAALAAFGLLAARYGEDLALGLAALRPVGGAP